MASPIQLYSLCVDKPEEALQLLERLKVSPEELKEQLDFRNEQHMTPLHVASFNGHLELVEVLVGAGANKDAPLNEGATPLHLASFGGHHEVMEVLVRAEIGRASCRERV